MGKKVKIKSTDRESVAAVYLLDCLLRGMYVERLYDRGGEITGILIDDHEGMPTIIDAETLRMTTIIDRQQMAVYPV